MRDLTGLPFRAGRPFLFVLIPSAARDPYGHHSSGLSSLLKSSATKPPFASNLITMFLRFTSGLALVLCLFAVAQGQAPLGDSNALVARAVKSELSDLDHPSSYWMYRVHKETK